MIESENPGDLGDRENLGDRSEAEDRSDPGHRSARDAADHALAEIRERILELDRSLIALVDERRSLVLEVGRLKGELGLPVLDPGREARVVRRVARLARERGVDEEMVRDVIWRIIASARDAQEGRSRWGPPPTPDPEVPDEGSADEEPAGGNDPDTPG